jgi:Zn-dependent membrane protease YugP
MDILGFIIFDFRYLLIIAPALLLGMWAQFRVRSTYAAAQRVPSRLSGAAAAQYILQSAGIGEVGIEQIGGQLSDHYDPRGKVLRLSHDVYHGRTLAAVGIAAHEAGHAIQDARNYAPLVIRNLAVPAAGFGSNAGLLLLILGVVFRWDMLLLAGIVLFGCVVFFQLVNLPVEFNASTRAKAELVNLGVVDPQEMPYIRRVLSAAALTYVAATLQAMLTLLYYIMIFAGRRD